MSTVQRSDSGSSMLRRQQKARDFGEEEEDLHTSERKVEGGGERGKD